MRLTLALAALGLAFRNVAGQQQWQDFGAMPDVLKHPFYDAVARSPSLAKRAGGCQADEHPCEQPCLSIPQSALRPCHSRSLPRKREGEKGNYANQATATPKAPTSTQPNVAQTPTTAS